MQLNQPMRRLLAVPFALSLILVGCGGGETDSSGASSEADGGDSGPQVQVTAMITIADFAYGEPLTVPPGATIVVVNEDSVRHDVDAKDGSFDTDVIGPGETLTFDAPDAKGTYELTCSVHPEMSGELIVA